MKLSVFNLILLLVPLCVLSCAEDRGSTTKNSTNDPVPEAPVLTLKIVSRAFFLRVLPRDREDISTLASEDLCYVPGETELELQQELHEESQQDSYFHVLLKNPLGPTHKDPMHFIKIQSYDNQSEPCSFSEGYFFENEIHPDSIAHLNRFPNIGLGDDFIKIFWEGRYRDKEFHQNCRNFLQEDGTPGQWGYTLLESMELIQREDAHTPNNTFISHPGLADITSICPVFSNTSNESIRHHIWIWIFTGMASLESDCTAHNPGAGVNDEAAGIFQFEKNWTNRSFRGHYCEGDMDNPTNNIRCATKTMARHILGSGNPDCLDDCGGHRQGTIKANYPSYWQVIRDGYIEQWLRKHPLCGESSLSLTR